jgi:subtilisin family serine protease
VNILAADDKAIAVSASDAEDRLASFSQHGPGLTDIFALGVDVPAIKTDGDTEFIDGTSFAAPYVSGIAALLQEASETINGERLSDEEFLQILQASARPLNTTAPVTDPGYRVADAEAALEYFIANAALYDDDPLTA